VYVNFTVHICTVHKAKYGTYHVPKRRNINRCTLCIAGPAAHHARSLVYSDISPSALERAAIRYSAVSGRRYSYRRCSNFTGRRCGAVWLDELDCSCSSISGFFRSAEVDRPFNHFDMASCFAGSAGCNGASRDVDKAA